MEQNESLTADPIEQEIKNAETVIYTGPNLGRFSVMQFQIYKNGLPPSVKIAAEKIPEIMRLIVPVSRLEETRRKIEKAGTFENRMFNLIQKKAGEIR